jgi:hypothetical protein
MHESRKLAGTMKQHNVDDTGLYIGAKIVDTDAWEKVKEKMYRGFSVGGWVNKMEANKITDLELEEISLVDKPANNRAKIDIFKIYKKNMEESMTEEEKKAALAKKEAEEKEAEDKTAEDKKEAEGLEKRLAKMEKSIEKKEEEEKKTDITKASSLEKAVVRMASILEKLNDRIVVLEEQPAATKTKSTMVEKVFEADVKDEKHPELKKKLSEIQEQIDVYVDMAKYERAKFRSGDNAQKAKLLRDKKNSILTQMEN